MKNKIILFSILILSALFLFSSTSAMTEAERQAAIAQVQTQIAQLQAQLAGLLASSSYEWCHTFTSNIKYGNIGVEVAHLQVALQKNGFSIASSEISTQSYYDSTTYAVNGFQEKYASEILWPLGLTRGTGFVGAATRTKLNELYGCSGGNNPPPPTTCVPGWYCTAWSTCTNGQQTRNCTDYNNCGVTTNKPATTQTCSSSCTPNWACTSWTTCSNGTQTRSCTDANNCGVTTNKPIITQSCTSTCTPNWSCGTWGTCSNNQQARTCTDLNNCGLTTNKPVTTQTCSSSCAGNWTCTLWSVCLNGQQTRICTDSNNCTNSNNKPATTQVCDFSSCTGCCPNWSCNPWGACVNRQQTRICVDLNNCNSTAGAPAQTQACVANQNCVSSWGCSDWGHCSYALGADFGEQVRNCYDLNLCTDQATVQKQQCTCMPTWDCSEWSTCTNGQHTRTCTNTSQYCINSANKPEESGSCVAVDIKANNSDGPLVVVGRDPRILEFVQSPAFNLTWTSTGASSCTASSTASAYFTSWTGNKAVSGSAALYFNPQSISLTWTFTITCAGAGGTATDSVQLTYIPYIVITNTPVSGSLGSSPQNISWTNQLNTATSLPIIIQFDPVWSPSYPKPALGSACENCLQIYSGNNPCEGNSKIGQCLSSVMPYGRDGYIVAIYEGLIVGVGNYFDYVLATP